MDSKTRLWRRKHSEKNITKERVLELERSLKNLNEQLSSARNESDTKDDLIGKQEKVAQEAIEGWEKAEAEAVSFKQELDDALYQKAIAEEKVASIDAALKDCVQQLHSLRNEQQRTVSNATVNMSQELEKTRLLEERLADANKRIHQLSVEKNNLCGMVDIKEKFIKDLNVSKSQSEADFAAIVERLDFSEKNNETLKYEVLMLQKELVVRHQEREFNLRSAESAQKQHLENVRKINRLESECHRLRVMIRKRLPGPAAISKMRSEVEMLGNCVSETSRNSNSSMDSSSSDFAPDIGHDSLSKQVRLNGIEDENKILKENLKRKNSELQLSRIMFARTASKLSQTEKQLKELSKGPTCLELARSSSVTCELPLASVSEDCGIEDDVSCAESWASALMTQLEHFRKPATPLRAIGSSQSSLMDDFDEMEKVSISCVDKPGGGSSTISGEDMACLTPKALDLIPELQESIGKELVPLVKSSDSGEFGHGDQSSFSHHEKYPSWLQDILKVILQKHYAMHLNLDVILHDVRVALSKNKKTVMEKPLDSLLVPHHCSFNSGDRSLGIKNFLPSESGNQLLHQLNLEKALYRIIELTEGFIQRAIPYDDKKQLISSNDRHVDPRHKPVSCTRQTICIFLLESPELTKVLQRFIVVCNNMLCREAEIEKFVSELASILGWIIEHCFSLKDISAMQETIQKDFGDQISVCDDDAEVEFNSPKGANHETGAHDKFNVILGKSLPSSTIPDVLYALSKMDIIGSKLRDENRKLKHKITNVECGKKDLEEKLKSASAKNHSLFAVLQESEKCISILQEELRTVKDSRGLVEEQIEDQKLVSQDLGTQLTVARVELNETHQKFSSLEAELEEKSDYCEELETTCLELQLQIESISAKDIHKFDMVPEEKELRTDWEISAASEKLAECQETILQLGKKLKALASPKDVALFDNVITPSAIPRTSPSPLLLGELISINNAKFEDLKSPQTPQNPQLAQVLEKTDAGFLNGQKSSCRHALLAKSTLRPHELGSIPKQQKGGIALLKKLLSRKER